MTPLRLALVALAASALLLAGASTATAAVSVSVTGDQGLRIAVSGGNATEVGVRPNSDGTKLEVTEQSSQMVPGSGCIQVDSTNPQRFRCNRPPLNFVTFIGGTARDKLFVAPGSGDCLCAGGTGNDELTTADGADLVEGAEGTDVIDTGAGGDLLRGGSDNDILTGGPGTDRAEGNDGSDIFAMGGLPDGNRDELDGGSGRDEVSYGARRAKVIVTLGNDLFDDGAPIISLFSSENDNARAGSETVTGGTGPDELSTRNFNATLIGGAGDDRLQGADGGDTLRGDTGSDAMLGGLGSDTLMARDAIDDQVNSAMSCGGGTDILDADVRDDDTRPLPVDCEQVSQGMVGETRNVVIRYARRSRRGRLRIGLRCSRRTRNGCRGRLRVGVLRRSGRRTRVGFGRSVRYRVRRGRSKVVVARVRGRRTPRRGTRVRVFSREGGTLGPRTTFRTLRIRR